MKALNGISLSSFLLSYLILVFLCVDLKANVDLTKYFPEDELLSRGRLTVLWINKDESSNIIHYATYDSQTNWQYNKIVSYNYNKDNRIIPNPPQVCNNVHSCLLVIAPYPFNCSISNFEDCALIIIPLTERALLERYKGQVSFLNTDISLRTKTTDPTILLSPTDSPTLTDDSRDKNIIEKADIYRIYKDYLYFVNYQISSIQVIDISDKHNPRLVTSSRFERNKIPKELFIINDFIFLVSDHQYDCEIDVLKHDNNSLITVDNLKLPGNYLKSMRKNENIYLILSQLGSNPTLYVLRLQPGGKLERINTELIGGTNTFINLSSNYLVLTSQVYLSTTLNSKLSIYALTETEKGIRKIGDLILSGRVPSDRHIHLDDSQGLLRVVYYNQRSLSTNVGIYDLRKGLLTGQIDLLGEIRDIAKGESLHGAVFTRDRVYLVTYLMKDPLFVIDTSDPKNPKVLGQLIVPGWNEQLVFNNNLIFGLGYDDQPYGEKDSRWVRRVSATLFDVSIPDKPRLLSRVTPFAGDPNVFSTISDALHDERAFFVNWSLGLGAFPFNFYSHGVKNYIQVVRIEKDSLIDLGNVDLPVSIRRVFAQKDHASVIYALGEQELNIIGTSGDSISHLGSLELSRIYSWLGYDHYTNHIIAGSKGTDGIYKLYRITTSLNHSEVFHNLATSFSNGIFSSEYLLFYNPNNRVIQLISLSNNKITKPIKIDHNQEINLYFEPIIKGNRLYLLSQRYDIKNISRINPIIYENYLHEYEIDITNSSLIEKNLFQIPGIPLGFNTEGELITYESTLTSRLRMNILSLKDKFVILKNYKEFDCGIYKSLILDNKEKANSIHLYCAKDLEYRDPIILNKNDTNLGSKIVPPILPNFGQLLIIDPVKLEERIKITNLKDRFDLIKSSENYLILKKYNLSWYCPPGRYCIMNELNGKIVLPDVNEYWLTRITKDGLIYLYKFEDYIGKQQALFLDNKLFYVKDSDEILVISLK